MSVMELAAILAGLAAVLGAIVRLWHEVRENRKALNGRMDQLIEATHAAGVAHGRALGAETSRPPQNSEDES